jgi:hypothetical protein
MARIIGPSFSEELLAAGVSLEGIAWGEDGQLCFVDDVPQAVRDTVAIVLAAHDPTREAQVAAILSDKTACALALLLLDEVNAITSVLLDQVNALRALASLAPYSTADLLAALGAPAHAIYTTQNLLDAMVAKRRTLG